MANCAKFLEAQEHHAKKSHPKCRRRRTSPRIPKTLGPKTKYEGYLARFKERHIHLLDSSAIQLVLNSIDWARHRRKKAAAKLHMNLDLGAKLPSFAIVERRTVVGTEADKRDEVEILKDETVRPKRKSRGFRAFGGQLSKLPQCSRSG